MASTHDIQHRSCRVTAIEQPGGFFTRQLKDLHSAGREQLLVFRMSSSVVLRMRHDTQSLTDYAANGTPPGRRRHATNPSGLTFIIQRI